jgi:hypothetical protein
MTGCQTTEDAATATVNAATAVATTTTNAVESMVGIETKTGPALARAQMEQQAGRAHFANSQLISGKSNLQMTRTAFGAQRDKFVSSPFVQSRQQFRGEHATPNSGPVLGPAVGDSASALAILAAANAGIPLPVAQPVLAQLLPGFGY